MGKEDQTITYRIYFVTLIILLMAVAITIKLTNIQWAQGELTLTQKELIFLK